jgi:hypothetical protein
VSAIPITEKLLLNARGWQAMKPARELLKGGRVSEAKYEPPLLSGYVREGGKKYRSGLRIKTALDVENLCSCWESRSAGKICAHSVAVGLCYLNPPTAAAPVESTIPEAPAGPRFVAIESRGAGFRWAMRGVSQSGARGGLVYYGNVPQIFKKMVDSDLHCSG